MMQSNSINNEILSRMAHNVFKIQLTKRNDKADSQIIAPFNSLVADAPAAWMTLLYIEYICTKCETSAITSCFNARRKVEKTRLEGAAAALEWK